MAEESSDRSEGVEIGRTERVTVRAGVEGGLPVDADGTSQQGYGIGKMVRVPEELHSAHLPFGENAN